MKISLLANRKIIIIIIIIIITITIIIIIIIIVKDMVSCSMMTSSKYMVASNRFFEALATSEKQFGAMHID